MDCLFCKIIAGEIPSTKIYEDEYVYVFKDINPIAPIHYLLVPKIHIADANGITPENSHYIAKVFEVAAKIAEEENIPSYKIINNCGKDAGQTVFHIHFHLISGKRFKEHKNADI
ncbi:MAG: histidine triad nucleotide-binding protein [Oscillospiraceae bacterium]|jgi:histidine triad (HIT) family protein|nr:histidine triad nucleotide-binding protein [Oscillospiraceae bacterium]